MTSNEHIREIVDKIMIKRDLAPRGLSKKAGLHESTLRNFRRGARGLTLDSADRLLGALGLRIAIVRQEAPQNLHTET